MVEITNKQIREIAGLVRQAIYRTAKKYAVNPAVLPAKIGVLDEEKFAKLATHKFVKLFFKHREKKWKMNQKI